MDGALLGFPNAHRGKFILIIKTHWSRCKLVFRNHFSSECATVLRITWKSRAGSETGFSQLLLHDPGAGCEKKGESKKPCRQVGLPPEGLLKMSLIPSPAQFWSLTLRDGWFTPIFHLRGLKLSTSLELSQG
jgi:hypothetical protein